MPVSAAAPMAEEVKELDIKNAGQAPTWQRVHLGKATGVRRPASRPPRLAAPFGPMVSVRACLLASYCGYVLTTPRFTQARRLRRSARLTRCRCRGELRGRPHISAAGLL